ncbi:MAG: hypothetical protein Q9207_006813 [Kuettlingeria erythrocarpa]
MWNGIPNFFTFGSFASGPANSRETTKAHGKQIISADGLIPTKIEENLFVVSPYSSRPHLLDLNTLTRSQSFFTKALTLLSPVTHAYATVPYIDSFNWDAIFSTLAAAVKENAFEWTNQFFYVVVFRSQIPPSTDRSQLAELDKRAHMEAMRSGGLLKYWFGVPDGDGRNLATCIWRQREDAAPGSSGEGHKAAMRATIAMYSEWEIERLKLVVTENVNSWEILPWED